MVFYLPTLVSFSVDFLSSFLNGFHKLSKPSQFELSCSGGSGMSKLYRFEGAGTQP